MAKIWVFIQEVDGQPSSLGLELLTKARSLGETSVLYLGAGSEAAFATLGDHGAAMIYHLDPGDALPSAPAAAAVAELAGTEQPDLIIFGQAYDDRDLAGRLAARLTRSVLSNAVDIDLEGGTTVRHEVFGGSVIVTAALTGPPPHIVIVRPKSFPAEPVGSGTRAPTVSKVDLSDAGRSAARIVEQHVEEREGPQLEDARVIITGGRGLGSAERFELIERVAKPLRAATGATRAIVDAGWVPYAKQVGQTGKTVKPDVYIACAVSGAMQHLVGMKDAKIIIAINKDPDAPIFAVADLGIVGDVTQILPRLAEELEKRKG